ncbi:MAG TPA: tRNA pseudouridine(38-40) synthase TruA [Panacibacter sp.]|nr:tRNA pseudouridine(38-40) synthase TruA [Panacibacter sp.]
MHRYFIEVAYKGTRYSGFQLQPNANTVQAEVEKALAVLFRQPFKLTGSSRTDAGVHALQNFFHFDTEIKMQEKHCYNINAILPEDITVNTIYEVGITSHCRFNALSREYKYFVYSKKNPFLTDTAYYYPYKTDLTILQAAAEIITQYYDFASFAKRNTQVKTTVCSISYSEWSQQNECLQYNVVANRFLRGMVRALVATMLKVGRGIISLEEFKLLIEGKSAITADFSAPPQGLHLVQVTYPSSMSIPVL